MDRNALRDWITAYEWEMFQNTRNVGGRADCQNDKDTFFRMRRAQFDAWSDEAAESYLQDLEKAVREHRNLVAEKYLRMMKNTFPEEYEAQKDCLPQVTPEKKALVEEICAEMIAQTSDIRRAFPNVGETGRPLYSEEDGGGVTSVQTYMTGELLTYSERTLRLLRDHLFAMKRSGQSLAEEITRRSVCSAGFATLEEAERYLESGRSK